MSDVLRYEVVDGIAWMEINRPESRNAINNEVRERLAACTSEFEADPSAEVLVLTAAGDKAFCAGGDLKEMSDGQIGVPPPNFLTYFGRTVDITKPTIAAVNGMAFAGGFMLTQMCDLVIAADHAQFGISEAKVGRGAPWAAPLPWLVSPRVALQMLMTGDPLSAERARELGMVNEVVPQSELRATAQRLAERIRANAPLSVRAGKRMVYEMVGKEWAAAFDHADQLWEHVYMSEDALEGPRAFKEKRAPEWKGR